MNYQTTKYLMLIRPRNFSSNEETLESNEFQNDFTESTNLVQIREQVDVEFINMVDRLSEHGIDHIVFDDNEGPHYHQKQYDRSHVLTNDQPY